jgi:hypothetical protein
MFFSITLADATPRAAPRCAHLHDRESPEESHVDDSHPPRTDTTEFHQGTMKVFNRRTVALDFRKNLVQKVRFVDHRQPRSPSLPCVVDHNDSHLTTSPLTRVESPVFISGWRT